MYQHCLKYYFTSLLGVKYINSYELSYSKYTKLMVYKGIWEYEFLYLLTSRQMILNCGYLWHTSDRWWWLLKISVSLSELCQYPLRDNIELPKRSSDLTAVTLNNVEGERNLCERICRIATIFVLHRTHHYRRF